LLFLLLLPLFPPNSHCCIDTRTSEPSFNACDRGVPEETHPAVARACRVTLHVRPGDWLHPQTRKGRPKTDSRENCRGPQHPTRMCRAWMPADCVCCRWQQRAGDSGATGTAAHEPPSVARPTRTSAMSRGFLDKLTTSQTIPRTLKKRKLHYRAHSRLLPVSSTSDINPVQPTSWRSF